MSSMIIKRALRGAAVTAVAAAFTVAAGAGAASAQDRNYILSTASTGGTYYPVGVALATLTKVKLQPKQKIGMSAINSAGSGENIKLLRENEAQFAIVQGLFGAYAVNGTGPVANDGPQKDLRSITMLWQNVEQFVVPSDKAKTGTVSDFIDLKGAKASLGRKNSGTLGSNNSILKGFGIDAESYFEPVYLGYGPSADALQNGNIEIMSTPGGVPTSSVTRAMATMGDKITVLDFTDDQIKKANTAAGTDLWVRYVIPAGTYPGQTKDINTIGQPNFLAVRSDLPEEDVYLITKTIYENLPFLQAIHKATTAMSLDKALAGLPAPLHPGAAKYYKEAGLTVPASLMAK